jgi:hypothetical protein
MPPSRIEPGDIFYIPHPYEQNPLQSKSRPVVVLRDEHDGHYLIAPITGTNHTGWKKGIWILKDSEDGKKMGLTKDSFIVVDKKFKWPSFGFSQYFGHCHLVDELLRKL